MLLVLLIIPGGLGDLVYRLRDGWLRWVARRHGIVVPSLLADVAQPGDDPDPDVIVHAEQKVEQVVDRASRSGRPRRRRSGSRRGPRRSTGRRSAVAGVAEATRSSRATEVVP